MTGEVVIVDQASEKALLAGLMTAPSVARVLLADEQLRPEHFYNDSHRLAFEAIVDMADRGEQPDELTVAAALEGSDVADPKAWAFDLTEHLPPGGSLRPLARHIRGLHHRRQLQLAGYLTLQAAASGDMSKLAEAETILTTPADAERTSWSPEELQERFAVRLDEAAPEMFPWPFAELNRWTGGGIRRKQVVLIGGWTSHGKSILYDQVLEHLAFQGLRVHSYINEMSEEERMNRTVARVSGVPFELVHAGKLTAEQQAQMLRSLTKVRVGITECAGWTAPEIARHIRWNRWDVAGVDIIHEIAHREERDLAEIAQVLRSTAKSVGCALVACVHLNDNRVTSPQRPVPVQRDIRGSGMLSRGADIVLLVHRDDDEDGVPTNDGALLAPKIRNGKPSAMKVVFDPRRMRFLPRDRGLEAVA